MAAEKRKGGRETEPMETEQELTPQEYEHLLAQYESSFKNLQEGQIIRGRVLSITPSEVIVDIGYKSEGMIPLSEFTDFSGQVTIKQGDPVDVLLERTEDQNGYVVLSKDKAEKMKVWGESEKSSVRARPSAGASSIGSREAWPSTSASRRFCPDLSSTSNPSRTSRLCAARTS